MKVVLASAASVFLGGGGRKLSLYTPMVGSLKMNTALEYSTRVVQEGDRRCKKSTLNDLAYPTPLRIPLMNPVRKSFIEVYEDRGERCVLHDLYCTPSPRLPPPRTRNRSVPCRWQAGGQCCQPADYSAA